MSELRNEKKALAASAGQGMTWYSIFSILLAIGFLYNFILGFSILTGSTWISQGILSSSDDLELLYDAYPSIKALDLIYGLVFIGLSVYQLFIAAGLREFRKKAPGQLDSWYLISIIASALRVISLCSILGTSIDASWYSSYLVPAIVMAVINHNYFKKRRYLFDR